MTHRNGLGKPHVIIVVDNLTPEIWDRRRAANRHRSEEIQTICGG
jgi:hypothetical protein